MRRILAGCDINASNIKGKIADIYEIMRDDKVYTDNMNDVGNAFRIIYENETGIKLEDSEFFPPDSSKLAAVKKRVLDIKKFIKRDGRIGPKILHKFYATSSLGDKVPTVKNLIDEYIKINYELKGRQYNATQKFQSITSFLKAEAIERGYKWRALKNPAKEANRLESRKLEALAILKSSGETTPEWRNAKAEFDKIYAEEKDFYNKYEGQLFRDLVYHIEENVRRVDREFTVEHLRKKGLTLEDLKKMTSKQKEKVLPSKKSRQDNIRNNVRNFKDTSGKAITGNMIEAVETHIDLMDTMYNTQSKGIDAFIEGVQISLKDTTHETRLTEIISNIKDRIMPDFRVGYFPRQIMDENAEFMSGLMPHLERVNQEARLRLDSMDDTSIDTAMDGLDGYLSKHSERRNNNSDQMEYSKNYLTVVKNHIDEINRFNFISFTNVTTKKALKEVMAVWNKGEQLNGLGKTMHDFILDMHTAQTGGAEPANNDTAAALRLMLGAQFVSKLGWNLRSGVRNATQNMLNWVHFGFTANRDANKYIQEKNLTNELDEQLDGKGLLFLDLAPELQEATGLRGAVHKMLVVNEDGSVRFKSPSKLEKAESRFREFTQDGLGKFVSAGSIMQKVENYNRKRTYKTAYAIMHKKLTENAGWKRSLKGKSDAEIDNIIRRRSDKYATNMVTMLHFDYSDVSKAPFMRTPLGKVLFQFQHYGLKYFEYNAKMLVGAKNDIVQGNWKGDDIMRAYRMALIFFIANGVLETATGIGVSNLVQHDTYGRFNQISALLSGDEETIKDATYGRGLTGIAGVGGPMVSDFLRFGNLSGFIQADDSDLAKFAVGYEEALAGGFDQAVYESFNILSGALTRVGTRTLPMALGGNPGRALTHELGLYETAETRKKKKDTIASIADMTDNEAILASLDYIQRSSFKKKPKKKEAVYAKSYI